MSSFAPTSTPPDAPNAANHAPDSASTESLPTGATSTQQPRITLVTPCFNQAETIAATLRSILMQTYPNLDYHLRDGGSDDTTLEIVETFRAGLSTITSGPDDGPYAAIEAAFNASDGEIMGWLNADDCLHPNALRAVATIFSELPDVDWITGVPTHIDGRGVWHLGGAVPRWSRTRLLSGDFRWIQQESTFWRRTLWERAGAQISRDYPLAADLELWVRFSRHARLHGTTTMLGAFRFREGQRSGDIERYEREAREILRNEPQSNGDRARLRNLNRARSLQRIPLIGGFLQADQLAQQALDLAPLIEADRRTGRYRVLSDA